MPGVWIVSKRIWGNVTGKRLINLKRIQIVSELE